MSNTSSQNITILIADDEAPIRLVVGEKLRSAGYRVIEAANGEDALDAARASAPAAVISDLQMPYMNGLALATALKSEPATADVPVLLLTARGHILTAAQLAPTNIKRVMSKPFGVRELLAYVQQHLAPMTGSGASAAETSPAQVFRSEAA